MALDDNVFLHFTDVYDDIFSLGTIDDIRVDYVSIDDLEFKPISISINGKELATTCCDIRADLPVYDGT